MMNRSSFVRQFVKSRRLLHGIQILDEDTVGGWKRQSIRDINFERPLESNSCGQQQIQPTFTRRIFGGANAIPHSWPWVSQL